MKDFHDNAGANLKRDAYATYRRNGTKAANRELAVLRQFFIENPSEEIDADAFKAFKKRFPEITLTSITILKGKRTILRKKGVL